MSDDRAIGAWLLACCLILFALVVVGGATRLTGSGLSIVDWRPVTGVMPPLSAEAWHVEFDKYRESPQYRVVNRGMSLDEFKRIYRWEWGHRALARVLGLAFALPLAWFWMRGRLRPALKAPLVGILALGALQGWMGWYMVSSGLVDVPRVSPYRLAAHLGLALVIFAWMFWLALQCLWPQTRGRMQGVFRGVVGVLAVTIVSGAFVAGLKAGYLFGTFPLMGDRWIPEGLMHLQPVWRNFFENPVTAQFVHRLLGMTTLLVALGAWAWALHRRVQGTARVAVHAMAVMAVVQATLGISTLLLHVPIALGTLHQGGAVLLLATVLATGHFTRWSG